MENKIYAIIVNYNGIHDTLDCILSLRNSTVQLDIVVVDNGSSPSQAEELRKTDSGLVVIRSENNLGFSGGNNVGIKYALCHGADYIMLINNDTVVEPHMIEHITEYADSNCVVAPYMYYYSAPERVWYGGGRINRFTGIVRHRIDNKDTNFITGCCFLAHRSIFEIVGLLNDNYFMYCEDTDFSIKLYEHNINIKIVKEAILWHKIGVSSGGDTSEFATYYMNRNKLYYIKTNREFFYLTALPFTYMTRFIRICTYRIQKDEKWKVIFKAVRDYKANVVGQVTSFK